MNPFWNFLRLNIFPLLLKWVTGSPSLKRRIFPRISQIGINYPNSTLTLKSAIGKVKAGDRMPYFVFADGSQIFDYLTAPAFKLLYFGDSNRNESHRLLQTNLQLVRHQFAEIPQKIFGNETDFYVLLRPDNHISYIGKSIYACNHFMVTIGCR